MEQQIIYYKNHSKGTPQELMDNPDLYRRIDTLNLFDMLFCGIATEDNKREIDIYAKDLAECILLDNYHLVIEGEFKKLANLKKEMEDTFDRKIKIIKK